MIFYATQIDETYQNNVNNSYTPIVNFLVEYGHKHKITYSTLSGTLNGYTSILLTIVGIIVTGWINLSNRLEQTVYGIRRKELFSISIPGRLAVNSYIGIFTTPAWMIYALIRGYCFTVYFIMAMIWIQFSISNLLLALSYNNYHDYKLLLKKILHSLDKIRRMEDFHQYDELLNTIASSVEKNAHLENLSALFFDILKYADAEEPLKIYKLTLLLLQKYLLPKAEHNL